MQSMYVAVLGHFSGSNQTSCYTKGLMCDKKTSLFFFLFQMMVVCGNVCGWTALFAEWGSEVVNVGEPALLCLGIFRESHAVPSCCSCQCYLFCQRVFVFFYVLSTSFCKCFKPCVSPKTSEYWLTSCSISHYFLYEAWTDFNHISWHLIICHKWTFIYCFTVLVANQNRRIGAATVSRL